MALVKATVDVRNDFPNVTRTIIDGAREGVEAGARAGAEVAAAIASQRVDTGRMSTITAGNATRTVDGWVASFVSRAYWAVFHEWGTLGNRRKPLKQGPRTDRTRAPGTGIAPLRFMSAGRTVGRRVMLDRIRRSLPR